nr:hypothetical protein [Actinomycetota bacterium]
TYNETRKESRSIVRHHLWEKVRYQHKVSALSLSSAITHQPSKYQQPTSRSRRCGGVVNLRDRIRRLEQKAQKANAPTWQEVVAATKRGAKRARAKLVDEPVDEEEAKRDGELLERWRRSQGIGRDVIAQRADEVRARLLMKMK